MKLGICVFCGKFGKMHLHHTDRYDTIVVCPGCHSALHDLAEMSIYLGKNIDKWKSRLRYKRFLDDQTEKGQGEEVNEPRPAQLRKV